MKNDLLYQIALTMVNGIGPVQAKQLTEKFGTAENIFKAKRKELGATEGIGELKAKQIKDFSDFSAAEAEIDFCESHRIETLFLTHPDYPQRLLNCYDSPTLLYYRGNTNLNATRIISIIGTRINSEYGKQITEQFVKEIQSQQVLIVSGLAFGIDAIAHRAALQQQIPTVGVLAHGLDTIYPSLHTGLAKEMLLNGGLLTEFRRNTNPDKHNFPRRNRIVAGMCDATLVVETGFKGGSMITAELAFNYNRDVFAVPGKITDSKSGGCLKLIQQNKAILFTDTAELIQAMGWQPKKNIAPKQRELFIELSNNEKILVGLLQEKETLTVDELYLKSGLSSSAVAAAILNLELQNLLITMPGKQYKLV